MEVAYLIVERHDHNSDYDCSCFWDEGFEVGSIFDDPFLAN